MLEEALAAVLGQMEVVEEPVGILLVVARNGVDRDSGAQLLFLVEELLLPLVVVAPRVDEITRDHAERQVVAQLEVCGVGRPEVLADEANHAGVDHGRMAIGDRPGLRVGVDHEPERLARPARHRSAKLVCLRARSPHSVSIGVPGPEPRDLHMVDASLALARDRTPYGEICKRVALPPAHFAR